jgi:hypothetical protein
MASRILLAHPNSAATQARAVTAQLEALGYEVGALTARPRRGAENVVMLWSRAAWGTPALRAAARKAHAAGKLVCIRLDSAPLPVHGARGTQLKKGVAWRRLLSAKARPVAVASRPARARISTARAKRTARSAETVGTDMRVYSESSSRAFAVVLSVLLLGAVGLGVAYTRYPEVAAPIDSAANAAYTQASELAALAP